MQQLLRSRASKNFSHQSLSMVMKFITKEHQCNTILVYFVGGWANISSQSFLRARVGRANKGSTSNKVNQTNGYHRERRRRRRRRSYIALWSRLI
jgi:hypothetical protein